MQNLIAITTKRQATFPKKLLEALGVKPGDRIRANIIDNKVILEPMGKGILDLVGTMPKLKLPKGKTVDDLIIEARDEYFAKTLR